MKHCWDQEPDSRPDMPEVLRILRDPLAPLLSYNQVFVDLIISFCTVRPLNPPYLDPTLIFTKEHILPPHAQPRTMADRVGARGEEVCPLYPHSTPQPCGDCVPAWAELEKKY